MLEGRIGLPVELRGKGLQVGLLNAGTEQALSFSETATSSAAVASDAYCVRLVAIGSACHIDIAETPTATTAKTYLPADSPEYFHIEGGHKVSVIQNAATGTLIITEVL